MVYHSKYEICVVAGHAWEPRSDEYGQWNECARCGTLGPINTPQPSAPWINPKLPARWPVGIRWNYGNGMLCGLSVAKDDTRRCGLPKGHPGFCEPAVTR